MTTLLLITTVLVCPYGCLAGAGRAAETDSTSRPCCARCAQKPSSQTDDEQREESSTPDEDVWSPCVCEGAISEAGPVEPGPPLEDPMAGTALSGLAKPASVPACRQENCCLTSYGGGLRVVLQSFLC